MDDATQRMYHLEIKRLYEIIEQYQSREVFLMEQIKRLQPKTKSSQVARLFIAKSQWINN